MDWKRYYEAELRAPGSRERVTRWFLEADDPRVSAAIDRRAVLSFPHTFLSAAGPLQARVVTSLYRSGVEQVIALGVLHSGSLPAYRLALDEEAPSVERDRAFSVVRGAFALPGRSNNTPFGDVPLLPANGPIRTDDSGFLAAEFSLDTFLATMALASRVLDRPPLPVLPLYVGMTRDPIRRSFDVAHDLARWLRGRLGPRTALVTTGDLVHMGAAYGWSSEELDAVSGNGSAGHVLRAQAERMLGQAFGEDPEKAYQANLRELRNDQREILPVVAEYIGSGAAHEMISFDLSDYAPIFDVEPPCLVASALVAYG